MEAEAPSPIPSLPTRLLQVFFSPGELFATLRGNPAWFGALAVSAILVALSIFLIPADLWMQMAREQAIQAGGEAPPAAAAAIMRVFGILGAGIGFFIWAFIMAGILTLFFRFLFGDEGSYKQYLCVVAHALVIGALGSLLLTPLRIMQGNPQLTLNVGTFFSSVLEEGYILKVLKMLELFGLWGMAVMAIGVTKMDPRRSLGSAFTFFVIFAVGTALLFGLIPGAGG
jgi:hypothetical protein